MSSASIVRWVPPGERPEALEEKARKAHRAQMLEAEAAARLAVAQARESHATMQKVGIELVVKTLQKWLRLAEHPDFENAVGPLEPSAILKLAELVTKNFRLDTGQATENVAHQIRPLVDFSKFTQEERDRWRELAIKAGAADNDE
jgi:hypothetical protein